MARTVASFTRIAHAAAVWVRTRLLAPGAARVSAMARLAALPFRAIAGHGRSTDGASATAQPSRTRPTSGSSSASAAIAGAATRRRFVPAPLNTSVAASTPPRPRRFSAGRSAAPAASAVNGFGVQTLALNSDGTSILNSDGTDGLNLQRF